MMRYAKNFFVCCVSVPIMNLLFCSADKGTLLDNVCREKPHGSDGWIHGLCDVLDAQISRKYG